MTPAVRAVERAAIAYRVHRYRHDPRSEAYGVEAADALGVPCERVFKTLVAAAEGNDAGGLAVAVVPVARRLDLKRLAVVLGVKRAEMAAPAAAQRTTGYVVGGISPLGQRRRLPTVIDASALEAPTIFISAGRRGLELELAGPDLVRLTRALVGDIAT